MSNPRAYAALLFAATALATAPTASAVTVCASADAIPAQASAAKLSSAAECLVNQERTRRGLRPLRINARLTLAATRHARDMVARNYFSHDTRGGGNFASRIRRAGYTGLTLGENLAAGSGPLGTAREIVQAWMDSPGHRRNILDRSFREMGMGVAQGMPGFGDPDAATYALDFGSSR